MGLGALPTHACSIPVFRYALERWPADVYELVILHRGALGEADGAIAGALRAAAEAPEGLANVAAGLAEVDSGAEAVAALWKSQKNAQPPWLVLRYPETPLEIPPAWAGPLNAPEVRYLIDSPARRQIAARLLGGESVVWVLVESGEKAKDEAAAALLAEELPKLQKMLKLPEVDPDDPDVQGPVLRSSLPVKLVFSSLRISRADVREKIFVSMLLSTLSEPLPASEPAIVPVFGRGRALPPLTERNLSAGVIEEAARFLVGECSCQVKALNPGVDLLLTADWDALVEDREVRTPQIPAIPVAVTEAGPIKEQPQTMAISWLAFIGAAGAGICLVVLVWGLGRGKRRE